MVRVSSELLRNLRTTVALLGESFRIVKTRGLFQASDFVTVGRGPGNVTKGLLPANRSAQSCEADRFRICQPLSVE
jgi:hypothetical protein